MLTAAVDIMLRCRSSALNAFLMEDTEPTVC
ncbi:hypothetical protein DEU51_101303 [Pseudomonas jessenii]|uniref:Uncharacterized protein n=1 Tax=Pseudomonas jessenii TaxID=77298 RepID=A0A370SYP1_PSEJE|nr:hypothetical protein DEU51_101303 [Pseudomonas jessenii]